MRDIQARKTRPRYWVWGIMLILLTLFIAACGADAPTSDTSANDANTESVAATATPTPLEGEVVIAVVAPLSGAEAQQGQALASGARLAAEIQNMQGGLQGQRIVVQTYNDRGDADTARNVAQSIVDSGDNIVAILTTESADPALTTVRDIYLGGGLSPAPLVVVPASTNPLAQDVDHPQFFRLSAPNIAQASEIAYALQERNLLDVMVVHSPDAQSLALAERFQDVADTLAISLNGVQEVPDANDYAPYAQDIFDANPAALFLATDPFTSGELLRELYAIDFQGGIFAVDQALPYAVVDELGCQAEGLYRASVVPSPNTVMTDVQRQQYAQTEGRFAEPFSVAGYTAVQFITQAYTGGDDDTPASAATYARGNAIETLMGTVDFSSDQQGAGTMYFQQVQARAFADDFQRTIGSVPDVTSDAGGEVTTYLQRDFPADATPVVFADLNWNSALFHNAVARFIIEAGYDVPTLAVAGSTVPSFQRLVRGEVDVIMERYNFDDSVASAMESGQISDLGVLFSDAVQGWFVPRYVIEGDAERGIDPIAPDLASVDQLDNYAQTFASDRVSSVGDFYGGVPGWTAHKINCLKLKAYRLDDNYAQVTSASTADLFGALANAYDAGEPILFYLWAPTSPIARYDLVQLDEPAYDDACWATTRGCAYPTSDVRVLVQGTLAERAPDVVDLLTAMDMDMQAVSAVLVAIEDESLTPDEAAVRWLRDNPNVWSQWVNDDVAERINQALAETS
jgi:glycine betaine/proline transport system substrate-binding protein